LGSVVNNVFLQKEDAPTKTQEPFLRKGLQFSLHLFKSGVLLVGNSQLLVKIYYNNEKPINKIATGELSRRRKKEKKSHYKIMHFSLLIYGHNN
jgi:hypothetical protein